MRRLLCGDDGPAGIAAGDLFSVAATPSSIFESCAPTGPPWFPRTIRKCLGHDLLGNPCCVEEGLRVERVAPFRSLPHTFVDARLADPDRLPLDSLSSMVTFPSCR